MGAVNLISAETAKRYQAVPVGFTDDGSLLLAMANPTNVLTIDDVGMMTGRRIRPAAASVEDLNLLLTRLARMDESIEDIVDEEAEDEDADEPARSTRPTTTRRSSSSCTRSSPRRSSRAPPTSTSTPRRATRACCSASTACSRPAATVKRKMAAGVVSRIKIMADLDISEKRVPQDGRFALTVDGRRVDIRVVTLPLVNGEGVVLRILDKGVVVDGLESLGMQAAELERFRDGDQPAQRRRARDRPDRLGQVDDPLRGAARRSTTASAASSRSRTPSSSGSPGIKQMQIAPKAGVTFDVGLRSMLRADPDVIMVGEIRDRETAHIAVEAALTGHLVLSTLHTRDAPSALGRLIDMGIEPFLVSSAVDCIVAQRLVRMLCTALQAPAERLRGGARRARPGGRRTVRAGRLLALLAAPATAAASASTR